MNKFKVGDRVKCISDKEGFGNDSLKGEIGTIVFKDEDGTPLVEFDNMIGGHEGQGFGFKGEKEVKKGSCYWCSKNNLELISKGQKKIKVSLVKSKTRDIAMPPQIFYRRNILKRFMTCKDIKYLDEQYQKHKKGGRGKNRNYKLHPEWERYFNRLGKDMTLPDIYRKTKAHRSTTIYRLGLIALRKLKKI